MKAQQLAQEVASRYLSTRDEYAAHSENVYHHLRGPVQALTIAIFNSDEASCTKKAHDENKQGGANNNNNNSNGSANGTSAPVPPKNGGAGIDDTDNTAKGSGSNWRDYLAEANNNNKDNVDDVLAHLGTPVQEDAYNALGHRTKARLEACLAGISLAVPDEQLPPPSTAASSEENSLCDTNELNEALLMEQAARMNSVTNTMLIAQGLSGFASTTTTSKKKQQSKQVKKTSIMGSFSSSSLQKKKMVPLVKCHQMDVAQLVTRLELYIRNCFRVVAQGCECVVSAEPARALKARARLVVAAFIDTVDTVNQQSPVLTRLVHCLTLELLAVEVLSEGLVRVVRQLVADYVQSVSFASLAFLSSPERSADAQLTPMLVQFLQHLQSNWRDCVAECELERMLSHSILPELRHTFKTIEFRSIGHLLEVCQGFRHELQHIELPPGTHYGVVAPATTTHVEKQKAGFSSGEEDVDIDAMRQAILDLQRETITINGNFLPPVSSRKELISFLSQTLNSRALTAAPMKKTTRRNKQHHHHRNKQASANKASAALRRMDSGESGTSASEQEPEPNHLTSGSEADVSGFSTDDKGNKRSILTMSPRTRSRRNFKLSTVDFLTRRLLLAASRTGTGGDAYFVVRDLFGGDDVVVVPSQNIHTPYGYRSVRPGSIEIIVKLASVTIKCHGSFDVYPTSLVGEVEPLIQLHTTTSETISLQEVRASDSASEDGRFVKRDDYKDSDNDDDDDDDADEGPVMVVQERKTERTGWRTLSVRPALYEKYEEFSTPS